MRNKSSKLLLCSIIALILSGCGCKCGCSCGNRGGGCHCGGENHCSDACSCGNDDVNDSISLAPFRYNLYVENSGSMKGFFDGIGAMLKNVLAEYYYNISIILEGEDSITLNYINTDVERYDGDIVAFLNSAQGNCNAQYTQLDEILSMAMGSVDVSNCVNLLVSDCGFTSNKVSIQTAQADITKLFGEKLKAGRDLAVAIMKFDCSFHGKFFPGGIACGHSLPIYVWVFGESGGVKRICRLKNIKNPHETLLFQPCRELKPKYAVSARMLDKGNNAIKASEWKNRDRDNLYRLSLTTDISSVLLDDDYLACKDHYAISDGYAIDSIQVSGDALRFELSTDRPSPGVVAISLPMDGIPQWVHESNYGGTGVPPVEQTQNVLYLVEGVYDAYKSYANNYFTINIKIK